MVTVAKVLPPGARSSRDIVPRVPKKVKPPKLAKRGRKPWEPKRKLIDRGGGIYVEQEREQAWNDARSLVRHYIGVMGYDIEVAAKLMDPPCSKGILRKYFSHEIDYGRKIIDARLGAVAIQMATSGRDGNMTRFMARVRLGWRDGEVIQGGARIVVASIPGDDTI